MKRRDLDTQTVLAAIRDHGTDAYDHLCETYPPKVVLAAYLREYARGRTESGVSEHLPWLTLAGWEALEGPSRTATATTGPTEEVTTDE